MLKYLTKFALDVLPSVVATILGAYIVNHYINTKSDTGAPAAAMVAPANPNAKKGGGKPVETAKIPEPGIKAKGISERAMIEKSVSEGLAVVEAKPTEAKPTEAKPTEAKPAEEKPVEAKSVEAKPTETANASGEARRVGAPREERRDANDLARAA